MFSNYFSLCPSYPQLVDAYTVCVITVQSPVVNVSRALVKRVIPESSVSSRPSCAGPTSPAMPMRTVCLIREHSREWYTSCHV